MEQNTKSEVQNSFNEKTKKPSQEPVLPFVSNEAENKNERKDGDTVFQKSESASVFSVFSNLDIDMSLILPLVLFLGKEGADELLILALIYIMS